MATTGEIILRLMKSAPIDSCEASKLDPQLEAGHYARKQIFSPSRVVSWVHRGRFELGLELFRLYGSGRVVDYGCGDATFLGMLAQSGAPMSEAVGLELCSDVIADCERRFASIPVISFAPLTSAYVDASVGTFDTVLCMEVLEHVVELKSVVNDLASLLRPGGRLIVSVPVETGVPLIAKQVARTILGWRGVGDYPGTNPYTVPELWRSIFAGDEQRVARPVHDGGGFLSHDHKGFNWRVLRTMLDERFYIDRTLGSPVCWLPAGFNSQVWFVATLRAQLSKPTPSSV